MIAGLDANILCYALDPAYPEHRSASRILHDVSAESRIGLNPTVLHETYHTLVFGQKWKPRETRQRLLTTLRIPFVEYYNQSRRVSIMALDVAVKYNLKGRDSLILANFMQNNVPVFYTNDAEMLNLGSVAVKKYSIRIENPIR